MYHLRLTQNFAVQRVNTVAVHSSVMEVPHRILYIQGIGPEPEVQATFADDWALPNLTVEHIPLDWEKADYADVTQEAG